MIDVKFLLCQVVEGVDAAEGVADGDFGTVAHAVEGNGVFSELVKIDGGFIFGTIDLILDVVLHTPLDDIAYDFFLHFIFGFLRFLLVVLEDSHPFALGDGVERDGDDQSDDLEGRPESVAHDRGRKVSANRELQHLLVL